MNLWFESESHLKVKELRVWFKVYSDLTPAVGAAAVAAAADAGCRNKDKQNKHNKLNGTNYARPKTTYKAMKENKRYIKRKQQM